MLCERGEREMQGRQVVLSERGKRVSERNENLEKKRERRY